MILINYNFNNDMPIYQQVIFDIKSKISCNQISSGDKLPSSRELAIQYSINPNTASRVYKEMELQKLCYTKRGLGTFVTEDTTVISEARQSMATTIVDSFIESMKSVGYSKEEMIKIIKTKEIE